MTGKITEHPAAAKAAAALRRQLLEARRRAFAPPTPYALEMKIIGLQRRVEALEAAGRKRR
jgi:hypothetical protein